MARHSPRRAERNTQRQQRRAARQFRRRLLRYAALGGVVIVGLAVILGLFLSPAILPPRSADRSGDGPGTPVADQGRRHLASGAVALPGYYNSIPPTSGDHAPTWERCGVFTDPIPNEIQVHNLEHGFVIVQYNTQDQAVIDRLEEVVDNLPGNLDHLILAPYPAMEQTIALTAWGVVQYLDTVDEDAIRAFANAYRGRGPEAGTPSCDASGPMQQAG